MNKKFFYLKTGLIVATTLISFIYIFSLPVITQPLEYHLFVDQRSFIGIPNTQDVLSNIFFLIVGILGVKEIAAQNLLQTKRSWKWFFISILLVAPGSAYYHWAPNNTTLVWDRLPMSMGFMALYVVLLAEHISIKFERFLHLALFVGILSILVWVVTTDLRFYFWIQFSSFLAIPIILFLFRSRFTMKAWYMVALVFYGLAKWTEIKDKEIFFATNEIISGHSLKHILAAVGLLALWWMVRSRKEILPTAASGSVADPSPLLEKSL